MRAGLKRWKPYPAYKDSGVEWLGQVPEGWEVKQVRRVSPILRGASPRPIDDPVYFDGNGVFAWVRIADVTSSEMFLEKTTQQLSELGASLSVKLEPDSLFLSIAGSVGKPCITKIKCCIHDGFVYFPHMNINNTFLFYIFKSGEPYKGLGKMGTQLNLNTDTVGSIKIPVPSLPEQNAIAVFLDQQCAQIDSLIEKKQRMLDLLDEKRRAVITQAVTRGLDPTVPMKNSGVEWLGMVPEGWEVKRLKFCIKNGFQYGANIAAELDDPSLPRYIRITDMNDDGTLKDETFRSLPFEEAIPFFLRDKDILLARSGATVGKSFMYNESMGLSAYAGYLIRVAADEDVSPHFLYAFLNSQAYWQWVRSSFIQATIQNVSAEKYANLALALPPLPEQQAIADYLDAQCTAMDSQRKNLEKSIELLREYRASLITHAVTGKIDVRDVAPLQ